MRYIQSIWITQDVIELCIARRLEVAQICAELH